LIEVLQQQLESSLDLLHISCFQFPSTYDAFNLLSTYFIQGFHQFLSIWQKKFQFPLKICAPSPFFFLCLTSPERPLFSLHQIPHKHDVAMILIRNIKCCVISDFKYKNFINLR
jgi:hypothetical protein